MKKNTNFSLFYLPFYQKQRIFGSKISKKGFC